jgi:hypothetical protein
VCLRKVGAAGGPAPLPLGETVGHGIRSTVRPAGVGAADAGASISSPGRGSQRLPRRTRPNGVHTAPVRRQVHSRGAGDNSDRIRSDAALAKLCGACPIPASSGKTNGRHRLNRGGNRQANAALHRAIVVRMRWHPPTIAYVQRRTAEGSLQKGHHPLPQEVRRPRDLRAVACTELHAGPPAGRRLKRLDIADQGRTEWHAPDRRVGVQHCSCRP